MKVFRLLAVVAVCFMIIIGCGTEDDNGTGSNEYKTKTVSNITLQWRTDTLGNLLVRLSAPTAGWVAVGFVPSAGMQDANIIIGYVVNDTGYIRDDFGTGLHSHAADTSLGGTDDVTDKAGTETAGTTEITFTIPLNSGDARDQILEVGQSYPMILAWGNDDTFDTPHTVRVLTDIDI